MVKVETQRKIGLYFPPPFEGNMSSRGLFLHIKSLLPYVHRVRVINIPKTIDERISNMQKKNLGRRPLSASEQNFAQNSAQPPKFSYLGSAHGVLSICYVHNFVAEG